MSFRTKLTLAITLLVLITGATLTGFAFMSSRANTAVLADALFREVTAHAVTGARDHVLRVVPVARSLAALGERGLALENSDRLAEQLVRVLRANPGVSWISFSNEGGAFTGTYRTSSGTIRINQSHIKAGHTLLVEYDTDADGKWTLFRHENDTGYDPRKREFYQRAREAGRLVWLPPYIFYEQGIPGITCACPIYDASPKLLGVLTFDFDLNALSVFAANLPVSPNAKVMLLTPEGVLLAHPNARVGLTQGKRDAGKLPIISDVDDPAAKAFFASLRPNDVAAGPDRYRQFEFRAGGAGYYAGAHSFQVEDGPVWVVGAMAPKSDFLSSVYHNNLVSLLISTAAVLGAVLLAAGLARRVSGPVVNLAKAMNRIGSGDLQASADLGRSVEFRQLATALDQMTADLREGLRVRSAMAVAREVQQELMPPAAPSVPGLDLAGHSASCDETGGDYYDFLHWGGGGTLIAIGDVAGHGIGAALLMTTARGIVRSRAGEGENLGEIVTHLNRVLSADMQDGRFMTLCLAAIDPATASFKWSRAGHDPAIIYDPAQDAFIEPADCGGLPLGIDDSLVYDEHSHTGICVNQIILFGTDGIWDTLNPAGENFGKHRLREAIRKSAHQPASEISAAIQTALARFRNGARQRDDVTFVVVKIKAEATDGRSEDAASRDVEMKFDSQQLASHSRPVYHSRPV